MTTMRTGIALTDNGKSGLCVVRRPTSEGIDNTVLLLLMINLAKLCRLDALFGDFISSLLLASK